MTTEGAGTSGSHGSPAPPNNPLTNLEKEPVNSKLTVYQPAKKQNSLTETSLLVPFSIKVPFYIYRIYNEELTSAQKKAVREVVRQFIASLVLSDVNVSVSEKKEVNLNVNVNLVGSSGSSDFSSEYVDALKERIKQLQETARIYREKSERLERILNAVKQAITYGDVNTAKKILGLR